MSTTLNLADRLLAMGRHFQALGREPDAVRILGRLTNFQQLPPEIIEEARSRLAEMMLRWGRFTRARKLLTALLVQRPTEARYHYLMATALDSGERGNPQRAAEHFRQALALDPAQPRWLGEFGLLALRLGQTEEGLSSLRRAAELAPNDLDVIGRLAEGLREEGLLDEARAELRAARFRNPRDRRFLKLWNDFQFRLLRDQQASQRGEAILPFEANGPRLLPFVRPAEPAKRTVGEKIVRGDAPAALAPPRIGQPLPDKKHA
jgi:tetratricopeptide (TPR) repeat protein